MTDFFETLAERAIRGSLAEIATKEDVARLLQIQKNWNFYRGDQVHYLAREDHAFVIHNRDLSPAEAEAITSKPRIHINYVKLIVERYLNGVYGLEVNRKLVDETNQAIMDEVWKNNKIQRLMLSVQRIAEIEGMSAVIPRWKEKEGRIKFERYGAQHFIPIELPNDPTALHALILTWTAENKWGLIPDIVGSTLPGGNNNWYSGSSLGRHGPHKYIEIWTAETVQAFLGKEKLIDEINPYGEIPFAFFRSNDDDGTFWGQTSITDTVALNHIINRLLSDLVEIVRLHGFSLLCVTGEMVDQLILKPSSFLRLPDKGDAKYLTPNSPIKEIQEFLDWMVKRLADTSQIPEATITGGGAEASGFSLTIRWLPYTQMLAQKRLGYADSDKELTRIALKVFHTHTGQGNYESGDSTVEFVDTHFVPEPQEQQRAKDAFLLANDVITPLDLIRREFPALTEEQVSARFEENIRFNRIFREQLASEGMGANDYLIQVEEKKMMDRVKAAAAEAILKGNLGGLGG